MARPVGEVPVVVMDLEATGGRPPLHRLIEVAFIRRDPDGSETTFASLANPRRPLPWYVAKITGLTSRQVREAPPVEVVVDRLLPFLDGAVLVFHGSPSDMELLNYELYRRTRQFLENPVVCTIALTREIEPGLLAFGLDRVAGHLGIPVQNQHRAWDDAALTRELFDVYSERFDKVGISSVLDLSMFQGKLPLPPFLKTNLSVDLLNALPASLGAYVLLDERRRTLAATATANLRVELWNLFLPDKVLEPKTKALTRQARYLRYEVLSSMDEAEEAIDRMLRTRAR